MLESFSNLRADDRCSKVSNKTKEMNKTLIISLKTLTTEIRLIKYEFLRKAFRSYDKARIIIIFSLASGCDGSLPRCYSKHFVHRHLSLIRPNYGERKCEVVQLRTQHEGRAGLSFVPTSFIFESSSF